jgi:hypothetical protein
VKNINVPASPSTPAIQGDWQAGVLKMQGDSYPENAFELFGEIIQWVEDYLAQSADPLRLELQLLYLNTSSIKAMMDIFDLLEDAHVKGRAVAVKWHYDKRNERLAELAEEFKEDCTFPFLIASHE